MALFVVTAILLLMSFYVSATAKLIPSGTQMFLEGVFEWFDEKVQKGFRGERAKRLVTPLVVAFFLIVLFSNLFGVFPILQSVIVEGKPLMKTPTAHLSMTLAFTLITLAIAHLTAILSHPIRYVGNFIKIADIFKARTPGQFAQAILDFFLGLLDIVGEFAKVISLSCRLFGNMLAGELMVIVVMGLSFYTQFLAPIPFLVLGLLSAIVQALVFSLLAMQYISMGMASVEDNNN